MGSLKGPFLHEYLARTHIKSPPTKLQPSLHTLALLHNAHLRHIPFENLSLQHPSAALTAVDTDLLAVYKKLVVGRRGGYCFEQNGLFGGVLRGLGFDVIDGAARVVQAGTEPASEVEEAPPLPDRTAGRELGIEQPAAELRLSGTDHHILFVHLGGRTWLVDVGFGGESLPLPLLLPEGAEQHSVPDAGGADEPYLGQPWAEGLPWNRMARYRVRLGLPGLLAEPDPASTPHYGLRAGYYLQHCSAADGRWKDLYFFRLAQFLPQDFAVYNHYIAEHPQSHFRKNLLVARQTEQGRVTLLNDTLKVWRECEAVPQEERRIASEEDLLDALSHHFGIQLQPAGNGYTLPHSE